MCWCNPSIRTPNCGSPECVRIAAQKSAERPSTPTNTASPKLPSERDLYIYAMAIVNHTAERMGVAVDVRQANNDECDKFAIAKIKEALVNFGRC
jgi:hypothetical protein